MIMNFTRITIIVATVYLLLQYEYVQTESFRTESPARGTKSGVFVVAIMCLWDEALTLPMALDSTKHFIDEYVVIHKAGTDNTREILRRCEEMWNLNITYIPSNMTLKNARQHAIHLTKDYADMFVIQDGDEVFYDSGPTAIQNSKQFLFSVDNPFDLIVSKIVYLKHMLNSTQIDRYKAGAPGKKFGYVSNRIILIPHPTIFRNDVSKLIITPDLADDVPWFDGRELILHNPWKFDVSIKHPLRTFLREHFGAWSRAGSPTTIEEWTNENSEFHRNCVLGNRSKSLEETSKIYVDEVMTKNLQPYSEIEWYRYPTAIKKYIDAGLMRGAVDGKIL